MHPSPPQDGQPSDPNRGKVLAGTYKLRRLMGEGGMGKVYEAGHLRLSKKRYAVKLLNAGTANDGEAYARFRREAEIATEIGHPHIVEVHDFNVTDEGQPFMVMEYLDGHDLFDHIKAKKRLPVAEVLAITEQVAGALAAAHDHGIVHRDLKPENIFLVRAPDGDGYQVKLLDFGLSKIKHSRSRLTRQNAVFGTPQYMSPEQARGQASDVDHRTDIFALAVIVYHCLAGVVPFDAATDLGVLYTVCTEKPKPLSELVPGLSAGLDAVMARALAKRREDRHEDVQQFVAELRQALERQERGVAVGPLLPVPSRPHPRVSAGVIEGGPVRGPSHPDLPPGAPPLPQEALTDADPPVVVAPALARPRRPSPRARPSRPPQTHPATPDDELETSQHRALSPEAERPGIHNLETARKKLKADEIGAGPSIHELETDDRPSLPATAPVDIHDLSTGEVAPIAEELAASVVINDPPAGSEDGPSVEETLPHPRLPADRTDAVPLPDPGTDPARQRTIVIVVFAVLIMALGVAAAWLVSQV